MLSKLTIMGLNNYDSDTLWKNLSLPTGLEQNILIYEILRKGAEFSLLYPDLNYMSEAIGFWSKKWLPNFTRWVEAEQYDYEPLFNLDVKSIIKEKGKNDKNVSANGSGASGGTTTIEDSKAAMDSSNFQPTTKSVQTSSMTSTTSSGQNETGSNEVEREEIRQGNQGVTMSQEMLLAEYNVRLFNLYSQIADIFINEFCITIYN